MDKAKVYPRKRGFYVNLYWKGQRYRRFHYDEQVGFIYRELADQIASAINADIKKKARAFDPRQWFRTPGYEFQFNKFANKWLSENESRYAPSIKTHIVRYTRSFICHTTPRQT